MKSRVNTKRSPANQASKPGPVPLQTLPRGLFGGPQMANVNAMGRRPQPLPTEILQASRGVAGPRLKALFSAMSSAQVYAKTAPTEPVVKHSRIEGATPGCYAIEVSDTEYHNSVPGISSTGLKQLMRSAAHFRAWRDNRHNDSTPARRFGQAVHCKLLEPHTFDSRYTVYRGGSRRGGSYRDFKLRNANRTILSVEEMDRVEGCVSSLLETPGFPLRGYLEGAKDADGEWLVKPARKEFTILWTDEETGVLCKVRLDAIGSDPVIAFDAKTCGDARPADFTREIAGMNYDLQAAYYMEGVRRFFGRDGAFIFGAVEALAPHGALFYVLGPDHDFMANGARKVRHALNLYAKCQSEGRWPAYGFGSVVEPQMLPWMAFEA